MESASRPLSALCASYSSTVAFILVMIGSIATLFCAGLPRIINPDYYVIQDLAKTFIR